MSENMSEYQLIVYRYQKKKKKQGLELGFKLPKEFLQVKNLKFGNWYVIFNFNSSV